MKNSFEIIAVALVVVAVVILVLVVLNLSKQPSPARPHPPPGAAPYRKNSLLYLSDEKNQDHRIPERQKSDSQGRLLRPYAWYWWWGVPPPANVIRFSQKYDPQTKKFIEGEWSELRPSWWPEWILRVDMNLAIKPNGDSCEWDVQRKRCEPAPTNEQDFGMWAYNKKYGPSVGASGLDDSWRVDWVRPRFAETRIWAPKDSYRVNYLLWVYRTTPAGYFPKVGKDGMCDPQNKKKLDKIWDSLAGYHFEYLTKEGLCNTPEQWRLVPGKPWPVTYQGNSETYPLWNNNDIATITTALIDNTYASMGGGRERKTVVYAWPAVTALYSYTAARPNENWEGGVPSPYWLDYVGSPSGYGIYGKYQNMPTDFFFALYTKYGDILFQEGFIKNTLGGRGRNKVPSATTLPGDYIINMKDPVADFKYKQYNYMEITRGGDVDIWLNSDHPRYEGSYGYMLEGAGTFYPTRGKKKDKSGKVVKGEMLVAVSKFHACLMMGMTPGEAVRNTSSTIMPILQIAVRDAGGPDYIVHRSGKSFLKTMLNHEASEDILKQNRGSIWQYFSSKTPEGKKLGCGFNGLVHGLDDILTIQKKPAQELENDQVFGPAMLKFCLRHASGLYSEPIYGSSYDAIQEPSSIDGYPGNIVWTYESGGTSFPRPSWDLAKMNDINYVPTPKDEARISAGESIIIDKTHYYSTLALDHGVAKKLGVPNPGGRVDGIITIFEGEPGVAGFLGKVDSEFQAMCALPEMSMNFCWLNPAWVKEERYGLYDFDTGECFFCPHTKSHGLEADGESACPKPVEVQIGSANRKYPEKFKTINDYKVSQQNALMAFSLARGRHSAAPPLGVPVVPTPAAVKSVKDIYLDLQFSNNPQITQKSPPPVEQDPTPVYRSTVRYTPDGKAIVAGNVNL